MNKNYPNFYTQLKNDYCKSYIDISRCRRKTLSPYVSLTTLVHK